ncbi:MAG: tRNA preQ1(34) S-adenosylmethionine ribosyltransferase-isomerase QueA [Deltaproteobacteria bacterium]|nr:tRNA preQ1(34) S-adenosylmethionine ribosyltransferase-isomerase QueA [Deltaproteobacteria bacterium]
MSSFDYELPEACIAKVPATPRDHSRLMVLAPGEAPRHHRFLELPTFLTPGDLLVVNRTQVLPARLRARKASGGALEMLLVRPHEGDIATATVWRATGRPLKGLKPGVRVQLKDGTPIEVVRREGELVVIQAAEPLFAVARRTGEVPLPPYIERDQGPLASDADDYQTIFASEPGAVAAPTAGLHFTPRVLAALAARGVAQAELLLHVGLGTFAAIRQEHFDDVRAHPMHAEWYAIDRSTVERIAATKKAGGKIVAVGTTSVRALETWAKTGAASGLSTLFITPGFEFKVVDAMVTNFHLPRSTLLMLVAAFAGRERMLAAYADAVREGYRFFSYGDAMLVYPERG